MSKSKLIKLIMLINILVLVASFMNLYIINNKLKDNLYIEKTQKMPALAQASLVKIDKMDEQERREQFDNIYNLYKSLVSYLSDQQYFMNEAGGALKQYSWVIIIYAFLNVILLMFMFRKESRKESRESRKESRGQNP